jgi:AraC-like DNA-binding protein
VGVGVVILTREDQSVDLTCEERASDSPLIERIWRSGGTEQGGAFISMAEPHCGIVVTKYRDKLMLTVRGPETRATPAFGPPGAEFFGIMFKTGVFMPDMPPQMVMDRSDLNLPSATGQSFWLKGATWQFPDYENVDTFIDWLVRDELLVFDPVVESALQGQVVDMSLRTVQRRFLQATGLTHNTIFQIQRARYATKLLKQGVSILDTVEQAGYFDQPHLTRSLKQMIGLTPAQLSSKSRSERLSFLFNPAPPPGMGNNAFTRRATDSVLVLLAALRL